jgi:hypothetical protein
MAQKVSTAGGIVKRRGYLHQMMLLQDATVALPGWVGPTMAISLVIIAGSFAVIAFTAAASARQAMEQLEKVGKAVDALRGDLSPALESVRGVGVEAGRIAAAVGNEAEELVESTRDFRHKVRERMINLEALYDVLEGEIEETTLDVATTLRAFRTRAGWYRWVRRLLGAG